MIENKKLRIGSSIYFLFYLVITIILTYPLILHLPDGVLGHDALYASWLFAWGAHQIFHDPMHLFDTNLYYPDKNTLANGEHMLGYLTLTIPLFLIFKNCLLVHNILLILTMAATAWTSYLLAAKLTGSDKAGWIAGLIFGFCPFKFAHIFHIELAASFLFPLAFLGLFQLFKKPGWKPWVLMTVSFIGQGLMSWYYGIYLTLGLIFFGLSTFTTGRFRFNKLYITYLLLTLFLSTIVFGSICIPYFKATQTMNFISSEQYMQFRSADLKSFLIAPAINRIYGNLITRPPGKFAIASLFPGITCLVLVLIGIWSLFKKKSGFQEIIPWFILFFAGFVLSLGPVLSLNGKDTGIKLPYFWLAKVPGFSGFRVPERVSVLTMLALSVLAAYGADILFHRLKPKTTNILAILISIIILMEYFSVPIPYNRIPVGNNIPLVYKWLEEQKGDFAIIEYPFDSPELNNNILINDNILYNYYSTYHWKKIVNSTGFHSKLYESILKKKWDFPDQQQVDLLRQNGVRYIIIHRKYLTPQQDELINKRLSNLQLVNVFIKGDSDVVELVNR
ncbi:MAG: hypothetical protein A2161_01405 [Candidatus Schekmanbacteria bacterium RBG_13_48_7]|uniref:Uncharacterized protein n=1 Tax=Candidatus Schekmanbacteria bacterium RBG_13_48_7 TaxID=1817878 RepID=A0A1F7RT28_9BACT|nr:MAG: hypothetical protein A2161_01405 [Candidatus Schekmanbacteria bacterium RBG_13_48_7]